MPLAYKALGDYYYHCKLDYKRALEQYNIARKGLGEHSDLFSYIGYVKRRQGEWEEAVDYLTKAFKLNPLSIKLIRELSETLDLVRNYPKAEQLFDQANSLNLTTLDIYGERIRHILLWKGDTTRGISFLDESIQKFSISIDPTFILRELQLQMCHKNYQEILDRLSTIPKESIETQFEFIPRALIKAQVHKLLGQANLSQREYKTASIILQERLKKHPLDSLPLE
jgi:tetratricopeptide (TPR) repeat protein